MLDEYGTDLKTHSPHMLRSMLVDIIPTSFEDDIITRPEIKTYEPILKYCRDQADYRRVKLLASARIENHRVNGKINSLTDDNMPAPSTQHAECRQDRDLDDEPPAWAKGLIHAITQSKGNSRPRSPSPAKVPATSRQPSPKLGDRGRKRDSFFFQWMFSLRQ